MALAARTLHFACASDALAHCKREYGYTAKKVLGMYRLGDIQFPKPYTYRHHGVEQLGDKRVVKQGTVAPPPTRVATMPRSRRATIPLPGKRANTTEPHPSLRR